LDDAKKYCIGHGAHVHDRAHVRHVYSRGRGDDRDRDYRESPILCLVDFENNGIEVDDNENKFISTYIKSKTKEEIINTLTTKKSYFFYYERDHASASKKNLQQRH